MEGAPKKKKFVLMKPPSEASSPPSSALSRSRFDYSFEQLVSHILAKLLPDGRVTVRLSEKLVFGREEEVERLTAELEDNLRNYSGFVVQLEPEADREDIEYLLEEHYRARVFGGRLIDKCITEFFAGTKLELECLSFLKLFEDERTQRLYVRIATPYVAEFLDKVRDKARMLKENSVSDRAQLRGNRRELRKEFASITVDSEAYDGRNWREFLQRSEKLDKRDIEVIENKNGFGYTETVTVRLLCLEEEEFRKVEAFNYYFRHQNFIALPLKDSPHKAALLKKYGAMKENWLQVRVVKGFKASKWDDKTLLYKLRCGQVPPRRTNFANEPMEALLLIGLLPKVRQHLELLEREINTVPVDDQRVEIYLELEEPLRDAIRHCAGAQRFLESFARSYVEKFKEVCELESVRFPGRGMRLDLQVKGDREEEFRRGAAVQLEGSMLQEVAVNRFELDFPVDEELLGRLQEEGVLVVASEDRAVRFLASNASLPAALTAIQNVQLDFQSLEQETIECHGRFRLAHYLEIIAQVKTSPDFQQIFVTDPDSQDKIHFTISFIGPKKKNALFVKTVREKIGELEVKLGSYSEPVEPETAKFLVDDPAAHDLLLQKFKVSMMVDLSAKVEAKLEIEPLAISKQVQLIKATTLSRVALGSSIYFAGKEQLSLFRESFLEPLKVKAKRVRAAEFISQQVFHRKISLFYREVVNLNELLSKALEEEREEAFVLIVPQANKDRFIRDLLIILTSHYSYQQKKYTLTLLDPDPNVDLRTTLALPDFTLLAKQQQIIIEWLCEGVAYTPAGANKLTSAVANGSSKCLLTIEDLQGVQPSRTHKCNMQTKIIQNLKTGEVSQLVEQSGSLSFTYKGHQISFTQREENLIRYYANTQTKWFYLKLAHYEVNLTTLVQTNLYTGKQRKVERKEKVVAAKEAECMGRVHAYYDVPAPQIVFTFDAADERNLRSAIEALSNHISTQRISKVMKLKPLGSAFQKQLEEILKARASENDITYTYNALKQEVTAAGLDRRAVDRFAQVMGSEVEYLVSLQRLTAATTKKKEEIPVPANWQQQIQEIQKNIVPPGSQEFAEVQQLFAIAPIKRLQRIQNKLIYRKYQEELAHLTYLNGGKQPREMRLFHGTHHTDPELIWADREGGFNINYSSENNLLGMGVYFAQKAAYSHNYRFKEGGGEGSMFLCSVIVGDSQEMKMSSVNSEVKDTNLKENGGLKYESMKGKHDICDIYVVYKGGRAYPQYLIHY